MMKTDQALRNLQTAQYYAYSSLSKKYPELFVMYKNMYKGVSVDYNNKAFRCIRKEHELEFQELYEQEALKRGIKTNYHRRKLAIAKMRAELDMLEKDPLKPLTVRLVGLPMIKE
jgi:hypothetical protein